MKTCIETLSETFPVAKKVHDDSSGEWIKQWLYSARPFYKTGLTIGEYREIIKFKAQNFKILPGQVYSRQRNKSDGDIYDFKTLPAIAKICHRHGIYPDFC